MKKNPIALLSLIAVLFASSLILSSDDEWDMIDDLDHIVATELQRIENILTPAEKTAAYQTAINNAKSLTLSTQNIIKLLSPLNNNQIAVVLNTWLTKAVVAEAQGKITTATIKNIAQMAIKQYKERGLSFFGSIPEKNNYQFIGESNPASLKFKFFDLKTAKSIEGSPTGSYGEHYFDNSIGGQINIILADALYSFYKKFKK